MKRLDHFLAFPDTHQAVFRIRCIGAFRHIKIHRVVPPVILALIPRFIHRAIVKEREQMHMGDSQGF